MALVTKDDLTAQLNAAVKDSSERHRDDVHRFGTGVPKPTVVESTRMSFEPEKFADEGLNPDDKFLTRNKLKDGDGNPLPGGGPTGCHCESLGAATSPIAALIATAHQIVPPAGVTVNGCEKIYCARALQYEYVSDGTETFWQTRTAFDATGPREDGCAPVQYEIDWYFDPDGTTLETMLTYMDTPPVVVAGTPFDYQVVFYFICTRIVDHDVDGDGHATTHDAPVGPETDSGVYLVGICFKTL